MVFDGKRSLLLVIGVVLIAVLALAAYEFFIPQGTASTSFIPAHFTVEGETFALTAVATTPSERATGLMNTRITDMTFMLFVFPTFGSYSFWMYMTNTSLDMIWLNVSGTTGHVVYVVSGAPPCYSAPSCASYTPTSPANEVLEAKAGFVASLGISPGTVVDFS